MKNSRTAIAAVAAGALAVSVALVGCSSDDKKDSSSSTSTTSAATSSASTSSAEASGKAPKSKLVPKSGDTAAANETIATYIADEKIIETPVKPGDPGAPTIDLPIPEGWEVVDQGDDSYAAIVYTGPEAANTDFPPNFIAILSKLEGNVDAKKLIEYAGGEVKNLPNYAPLLEGEEGTLSGFPAYQIAATFEDSGTTYVIAQKTAVITGADGAIYVLQLNGTSDETLQDILGSATSAVDDGTTITP